MLETLKKGRRQVKNKPKWLEKEYSPNPKKYLGCHARLKYPNPAYLLLALAWTGGTGYFIWKAVLWVLDPTTVEVLDSKIFAIAFATIILGPFLLALVIALWLVTFYEGNLFGCE